MNLTLGIVFLILGFIIEPTFGYIGSYILFVNYMYIYQNLYINIIIRLAVALVLGILWQEYTGFIIFVSIAGVFNLLLEKYKVAHMWDKYEKK